MRAGRKDKRIEIQALTEGKGDYGADTETWTLYKEVWAIMIPIGGREPYVSNQFTSELDTLFRIDYISGISPKTYRIKYKGLVYDIYSVLEIEGRNQTLEIGAKAQGV